MNWISVNDKMPGLSEDVLACSSNGEVAPCYMSNEYKAGQIVGTCFRYINGDEGYEMRDVTHWMYYPEPYKE